MRHFATLRRIHVDPKIAALETLQLDVDLVEGEVVLAVEPGLGGGFTVTTVRHRSE